MSIVHVILSGGVGSRLWPVSRKSMPKQYIPMFNDKSLFQLTAERNQKLVDYTLIVGNKDNYQLSQADMERADISNYKEIIEAAPRNTAAAIAFSAFSTNKDDILLVTPSDHIITNQLAYNEAIRNGLELAKDGYLVTFGIMPSKPETGYGYIEFQGNDVISFREKPHPIAALSFIEQGNFLWNSGMFCFKADTYLEELKIYEPEIYEQSLKTYESAVNSFLPPKVTMTIPSKSIDYAVMEHSSKIKVIEAAFGWSDLGSFQSIWEHWEETGEDHHFRQNNCVVGSTKHVEFLGVNNVMLIETPDAILVLDKSNSQDVKKIYERLERDMPELVQ